MRIVIYADKSMEQYDDSITLDALVKLIDHNSELLSITQFLLNLMDVLDGKKTEQMTITYKKNCDSCMHYSWYYDWCKKFRIEVDGREVHDCFEER